ncbi:hypothetical protein FACS189438_0590 [Bacteroidia bacterium]|nr:hypothetical protein FACS189438_0590 [Bacteroidia bacterium]
MLCISACLSAQQKFNVQNKAKAEFYDDLETAIQKAVSGDTIYLPGAEVQVKNDLVISKKLAFIGAGCDVDSIGGLRRTEIKKGNDAVNINFREGSSGSLLTGCVVGTITFGFKDDVNDLFQDIENVTIWRNKTGDIYLGVSYTQNNKVKNIFIRENIITYVYGNNASNCWVNNNLISGYVNALYDSQIYNNVILSYINLLYGCTLQNNYFAYSYFNSPGENNIFNNNAFLYSNITFPYGTNTGSNNLVNQEFIRTFQVNNSDRPKYLTIRDTSPCKKAGTDGTDIGLYGGLTPYKSRPFNPHIEQSVISTQTDKDGKLNVNIRVSAQTR